MVFLDFEAKQEDRGRGIAQLIHRVGDVVAHIEHLRAGLSRPLRILEIGFGFGTALMELKKAYGDAVELIGINKTSDHGNLETMKRVAVLRGIFSEAELAQIGMPRIYTLDASLGIPLPGNHIDLAFSQVCFPYVADKVSIISELCRVLSPTGLALIHTSMNFSETPPQFQNRLEIWDDGTEVEFSLYLQQFNTISERKNGQHTYLEIQKTDEFGIDLHLLSTIDLARICERWHGTKSIYKLIRPSSANIQVDRKKSKRLRAVPSWLPSGAPEQL